jgi:polyvinyl alcohol dehydrogenase (cytochrome)
MAIQPVPSSATRPARRVMSVCTTFWALAACASGVQAASWPMFGQNAQNTAYQSGETRISPANASRLAPKWIFTTQGDVSARAAVVGGVVYVPDWGGYLHAVNASSGAAIWSKPLSQYTQSSAPTYSRTTPAVVNGVLYVGTQEGAWLLAINAATGALIWKTQLESPANDAFAIITASPTVVDGVVYTAVASGEEGIAGTVPDYPCCKARGSVVAVAAKSGKIKWQTYTVPVGYSGGGVWGSNLVVDAVTRTVYAGTGNNYSHPKPNAESSQLGVTYGECIAAGGTLASCNSLNNHVDAVLAFSAGTGRLKWARNLTTWNQGPSVVDGSDDWNVSCLFGVPPGSGNCPSDAGPDYDFASAPNLITYQTPKGPKTILGAGQKSGIYFALDPKNGRELWHTQVGPGSTLGGMEWGSASDGQRIYVQIANLYGIPWAGGAAGFWAALDPASGAVLWTAADPNGSIDLGPVTVANGVVYASSMGHVDTMPTMLALSAVTGNTLWSFPAGSSVNAGATVVNGVVYWGSGYTHLNLPPYTGNNKFYAFSLGGH